MSQNKGGCGLNYVCPANGGWGMVRIAMMIPESYQLFISPQACGRHGALGAIQHGIKDRVSYYYVDERDIIGGYDQAVIEAAGELLTRLKEREIVPKVVVLFVTCIDDLIGTDTAALADELERLHPGIYFLFCHMNPITEEMKSPPMVSINRSIFSLLGRRKTAEKDRGINCIGNLVDIAPSSELYALLDALDAGPVRHISRCADFAGYAAMAKSCCNLVFTGSAAMAAGELEAALGQPWVRMRVCADTKRLRASYEQMARTVSACLHTEIPARFAEILDEAETRLEETARRVRLALGDRPVAVDDFALNNPFAFARFLLERGFRVETVVYREVSGALAEEMDALAGDYPKVQLISSVDCRLPRLLEEAGRWRGGPGSGVRTGIQPGGRDANALPADGGAEDTGNRAKGSDADALPAVGVEDTGNRAEDGGADALLAVGVEAGYVTGAPYVADLYLDEGNFGFCGIQTILERMEQACASRADLKAMIDRHGLVV